MGDSEDCFMYLNRISRKPKEKLKCQRSLANCDCRWGFHPRKAWGTGEYWGSLLNRGREATGSPTDDSVPVASPWSYRLTHRWLSTSDFIIKSTLVLVRTHEHCMLGEACAQFAEDTGGWESSLPNNWLLVLLPGVEGGGWVGVGEGLVTRAPFWAMWIFIYFKPSFLL